LALENSELIVVGIGASAGGLESLKKFFRAVPSDSGLAFVVIQHLEPTHTSYVADLLSHYTAMPVMQAKDGMALAANCVYTIPPNSSLTIRGDSLHLAKPVKSTGWQMPIDFFFRSLAREKREKAICVILSGAGSDGTLGLREVCASGGIALAQAPETAQFDAMLKSAIATGMVDRALPVRELAQAVLDCAEHSYVRNVGEEPATSEPLKTILRLLAKHKENNFAAYKKATLLRRIQRRMGINKVASIAAYERLLQSDPDEINQLARDLLIVVSSFFRDPDAFEELRRTVIAPLVWDNDNGPIRVWVPGCSTGEEVYSLAMLLQEEIAAAGKVRAVQLFGSDIDGDALRYARAGLYPQSIEADVSEERLRRFFDRRDAFYQIRKDLREGIIFAQQNLLTDPPFSKLDLLSCRNLLIYIEPAVQKTLMSVFAFALKPGGYLFLGSAEGVGGESPFFTVISADRHIYRRNSTENALPREAFSLVEKSRRDRAAQPRDPAPTVNLAALNQHVMLQHFDASIALIDEQANILHFYGATPKYFELPSGKASLNLLTMVEKTLSAKLRETLRKAIRENRLVRLVRQKVGNDIADVTIRPVITYPKKERLFAAIFEPHPLLARGAARSARDRTRRAARSRVDQLESELTAVLAEFERSADEHRASSEELRTANEEISSINEELQSTNEALETAKEELRSVNEELIIVNSQLSSKVDEVTHVNDDFVNFLHSSGIAMVFLDSGFHIRRFTPAAANLIHLLPADVGRPVEHMTHEFINLDMVAEGEAVLRQLTPVERELKTADGRWFTVQCRPYRTLENKIDGVVFTFQDVTQLKESQISERDARSHTESIVETVPNPLLVLDEALRVVSANRAFYHVFQLKSEDVVDRSFYELGARQWDSAGLRQALKAAITANQELKNFEVEIEIPSLGRRALLLHARRIQRPTELRRLYLLAIEDYTDRKRVTEVLAKSEEQMRRKAQELEQQLIASGRLVSLGELTASMAHEFNNPLGIVMGFAEDLLTETDPASPQYRSLEIMLEESRRCQKIVQDLMEFARPRASERHCTDVGKIIDATMHLIDNRLYKQKVSLTREVQPNLAQIDADPQQLEQVLVNLYLNALDVMPDGGSLRVGAAVEDKDGQPNVVLTVSDTGPGIAEQDLDKIFQPFFTAKKRTGLGLGLPICDRIVKNHGGKIDVESRLGKGSTFRIYLPTRPATTT
jgi:two-component system, chemotaxis family, CheB/CheR fusion protein